MARSAAPWDIGAVCARLRRPKLRRPLSPSSWARAILLLAFSMASKKRKQYIVGVDLGGTNIVAGAMSEDGSEHYGMRSIPTSPELGAEAVASRIVGLVEGVILDTIAATEANRRDFIGVGVGAPGPLDRERGVVIVAPNLGWREFPLLDRI